MLYGAYYTSFTRKMRAKPTILLTDLLWLPNIPKQTENGGIS